MARTPRMTYRTAVKLLSGRDPAIEKALDAALSGALLATTPVLGPAALAFIDAKNDIVKHGAALVDGLVSRLRGTPVVERSKNVHAAWTVLVISAFCDAATTVFTDAGWRKPRTLRKDIEARQHDRSADDLMRALLDSDVPFPRADETYQQVEERLKEHFSGQTRPLCTFLGGLAGWDRLTETHRAQVADALPDVAVSKFATSFRKLAAEVPELGIWLTLRESHANRTQILEHMETGLSGLRHMLDDILALHRAPEDRWHASLSAYNAAELDKPLIEIDHENARVALAPPAGKGFLNPRFRLTHGEPAANVSVEDWWSRLPIRKDLQKFLATFLLTEAATASPLLILGHPGAGKSLLSRVLAGRLPPGAFCPVRGPLRNVAASSTVLGQIETALHQTIQERVQWPAFVESLDGAIPVVILDGFDELVQATGASRLDYLEMVREFQEIGAALGRPVAVIVTSRTTVADRARIPSDTTIIKLEPFSESQVRAWIGNWNEANEQHFAGRGVERLDPDTVLAYGELAIQPILLLMLALYDAAGNGLKRDGEALKVVALYERLLTTFVEREVRKRGAVDPEVCRSLVEEELYRLSIVAFAMFNRGIQIVHEKDVESDFERLRVAQPDPVTTVDGLHAKLSPAQQTLSRFFFVFPYEARDAAEVSGSLGRSFEFLHATFGEFLVVRLAISIIRSLAAPNVSAAPWQSADPPVQHPLLRALLSFQALTKRRKVVDFLLELVGELPAGRREEIARTTAFLLKGCMAAEGDASHADYVPVAIDQPRRYAHYSFNLCLIHLAAEGRYVELPGGEEEWSRWAGLWRSQLEPDAAHEAASILDIKEGQGLVGLRLVGLRQAQEQGDPQPRLIRPVWGYLDLGTRLRWSRLERDDSLGSTVAVLEALRPAMGELASAVVRDRDFSLPTPIMLPLVLLTFDELEGDSAELALDLLLDAWRAGIQPTPAFACHLMRVAVRHSRAVPVKTLRKIQSRFSRGDMVRQNLDVRYAYVDLSIELFRRTGYVRSLEGAPDLLVDGDPVRSAAALVELESLGALPFNRFLRRIDELDIAELSRQAPGVTVKALNLLIIQYMGTSRDSEIGHWMKLRFRGIVEGLSPEARKLINSGAVEWVLRDIGS